MLEIVAFPLARELTQELARSALPESPVLPEDVAGHRERWAPRLTLARRRAGLGLRRLADLVEPAPECPPAAAGQR